MKRLFLILLFAALMLGVILIIGKSYDAVNIDAYVPAQEPIHERVIPQETGVFQRSSYAMDYATMPKDEKYARTLATYYNNRAFHGAPPSIPHPVSDDMNVGDNSCLKCHENGGFVNEYDAYTPVVPHPELVNCRQCHVTENTSALFKGSSFAKDHAPLVGVNAALDGSPPVIPHQIQLHENCLACHAGPSAPKEIRVTHPERVNCRQCHVLNNKEVKDIGVFTRQ